jgi:hypothetical protein
MKEMSEMWTERYEQSYKEHHNKKLGVLIYFIH